MSNLSNCAITNRFGHALTFLGLPTDNPKTVRRDAKTR
jgi:hypothetical protein